jgi:hypothetical protein
MANVFTPEVDVEFSNKAVHAFVVNVVAVTIASFPSADQKIWLPLVEWWVREDCGLLPFFGCLVLCLLAILIAVIHEVTFGKPDVQLRLCRSSPFQQLTNGSSLYSQSQSR